MPANQSVGPTSAVDAGSTTEDILNEDPAMTDFDGANLAGPLLRVTKIQHM